MNTPLSEQEQIERMAHRIYEEEGCPEGKAEEHWARAERIIHEQRVAVAESDREGVSPEALTSPKPMVP
jgi:hypothetical protein